MRPRSNAIGLSALLFVASLAPASAAEQKEPIYKGRSLREWIAQGGKRLYFTSNPTQDPEAIEALQVIGTNAIPFLLAWMSNEPPSIVVSRKEEYNNPILEQTAWGF